MQIFTIVLYKLKVLMPKNLKAEINAQTFNLMKYPNLINSWTWNLKRYILMFWNNGTNLDHSIYLKQICYWFKYISYLEIVHSAIYRSNVNNYSNCRARGTILLITVFRASSSRTNLYVIFGLNSALARATYESEGFPNKKKTNFF